MTTGTDLPDFVTYKIYTDDKVNSILSATLQHLDGEQIIALRDSLVERTPPLASEEISRLKEDNERLRGAMRELMIQYKLEVENDLKLGENIDEWVSDLPTYQKCLELLTPPPTTKK